MEKVLVLSRAVNRHGKVEETFIKVRNEKLIAGDDSFTVTEKAWEAEKARKQLAEAEKEKEERKKREEMEKEKEAAASQREGRSRRGLPTKDSEGSQGPLANIALPPPVYIEPSGLEECIIMYVVGEKVKAHYYQDTRKWFKGTIVAIRDVFSYDIQYDDGDFEEGVFPEHIQHTKDRPKILALKADANIAAASKSLVNSPSLSPVNKDSIVRPRSKKFNPHEYPRIRYFIKTTTAACAGGGDGSTNSNHNDCSHSHSSLKRRGEGTGSIPTASKRPCLQNITGKSSSNCIDLTDESDRGKAVEGGRSSSHGTVAGGKENTSVLYHVLSLDEVEESPLRNDFDDIPAFLHSMELGQYIAPFNFYNVTMEKIRQSTRGFTDEACLMRRGSTIGEMRSIETILPSDESVLGVRLSSDGLDNIVVTMKNSVQYYSSDGKTCLHNWILRAAKNRGVLTHAAIQTGSNRRFYVVQNDSHLLTWLEGEDLDHGKVLKLEDKVVSFAGVASQSNKVIVVLQSGAVQVIDQATLLCSEGGSDKGKVLRAFIVQSAGSSSVYYAVTVSLIETKQTYHMNLTRVDVSAADATASLVVSHEISSQFNAALQSAAYNATSNSLSLLWEGGMWDLYRMIDLESGFRLASTRNLHIKDATKEEVTPTPSKGRGKRSRSSSVADEVAAAAQGKVFSMGIGPTILAIAQIGEKKAGEEEDGQGHAPVIKFWDLVHGVLADSAEAVVAGAEGADRSVMERVIDMVTAPRGDKVFLTTNRCVYITTVEHTPLSLASALEKVIAHKNPALIEVNHESPLKAKVVDMTGAIAAMEVGVSTVDKWSKALNVEDDEESVIAILSDRKKTKTKKAFVKLFNDFAEKKRIHSVAGKPLNFSHLFVSTISSLCINDPKKELWEPIAYFLNLHCLSAATCPSLVQVLLDNGKVEILEKVLTNIHDLSERDTIKILRHVIKGGKGADIESLSKLGPSLLKGEGKKEWENVVHHFVNLVVTTQFNRIFMIKNLKKLSVGEVKFILQVLRDHLFKYSTKSSRIIRADKKNAPSLRAVLEWVSMIVEAHFTMLVRETNSDEVMKALVFDVQALAQAHLELCDKLFSISAYVHHLRKHDVSSTPVEFVPDYCIEVLNI